MTSPSTNKAAIFIRAAKASDLKQKLAKDDQDQLEAYLRIRTIMAEGVDVDGALEVADEHPGYLLREVGSQRVFVPFNLAYMSPSKSDLQTTIGIGQAIRVSEDGALCLSGSTTYLGRIGIGADLDFSEYRRDVNAMLAPTISAKVDMQDPALVWIKLKEATHRRPWNDLGELLSPPVERLKLDFVSTSPLGILPTTSVVLASASGEDGAANQSFAYQEAVIVGPGPVRDLVRADRLGGYISWLKRQIREHLDAEGDYAGPGAPIKALKRCLSLLLMLERPAEIEDVVNRLQDSVLRDIVLDARVDELERMAADMSPAPERLTKEIATLRERSAFSEDQRSRVTELTTQVAEALFEKIETLFEEAA